MPFQNPYTYHSSASIQRKAGKDLLNFLFQSAPTLHPQCILDIGCGTGLMTQQMLKYYPYANYYCVDNSNPMIQYNKKQFHRYKNIHYIQKTFDNYSFPSYKNILGLSNFSYQWSPNIWNTILYNYSQCNIHTFSTLTYGTLQKFYKTIYPNQASYEQNLRYTYPSVQSLQSFILTITPYVFFKEKHYRITFPSIKAALAYFKALGSIKTPIKKTSSLPFIKQILNQETSSISLDFYVFFAIMKHYS